VIVPFGSFWPLIKRFNSHSCDHCRQPENVGGPQSQSWWRSIYGNRLEMVVELCTLLYASIGWSKYSAVRSTGHSNQKASNSAVYPRASARQIEGLARSTICWTIAARRIKRLSNSPGCFKEAAIRMCWPACWIGQSVGLDRQLHGTVCWIAHTTEGYGILLMVRRRGVPNSGTFHSGRYRDQYNAGKAGSTTTQAASSLLLCNSGSNPEKVYMRVDFTLVSTAIFPSLFC
jgi:hypothetical protein